MTIEIRNPREDELRDYLDAGSTAFLERPRDLTKLVDYARQNWDLARTWGAFDDGRVVACFRSFPTEMTVPGGGRIPASAIAGVGVLPTHRRRGLLRGLAAAEHAAMRERGEPIGLLNASEYPIYGRFGYGMGCRQATWRVETASTDIHGRPVGAVELIPPDEAASAIIRDVFDAARATRVGEIRRREVGWRLQLGLIEDPWDEGWRGFLAIHRAPDGRVDGFARYHAESNWDLGLPRGVLHVDDLHATNDAAETDLWRFLSSVDWVGTLRAPRRSPSDRLPWRLTNYRAASIAEQTDGMFVRLHDLPRALEARTYAGQGSVVLEIIDPERPDAPERVHLDAGPDGARCTRTDRSPDLTIHLAALSGAYLGGTRLSHIVAGFGGADEGTPGALDRVERLFRTADEPWCSTFF
jgi:predicted acetyltransferase